EEGRGVYVLQVDAGSRLPDPDQLVGMGVGEGLQQHPLDDAEDGHVSPDADRERDEGHQAEDGRAGEAAEDVLGLGGEGHGPKYVGSGGGVERDWVGFSGGRGGRRRQRWPAWNRLPQEESTR